MSELKMLFLDIETSIPKVYTYGLWQQNISIANIIEHPRMIAFTAKWFGKRKIHAFSEYHQSRAEMLQAMWDLLDESDVVLGWNSRSFDIKWIQGEFAVEGMKPPSPFKQIDLMAESKKNFRFLSNKLSYVSQRLLDDDKIDYNMANMWIKVNNPETSEEERKKEWNAMLRYAKKDTALLEPLFLELRPWIRMPHPMTDHEGLNCRNCGSTNLNRRGEATSLQGTYPRYCCKDCGTWMRGTTRTPVGETRAL